MSRIAALAIALTLAPLGVSSSRIEAPPERAYSAFSPDPARRFDFWIGEWDVNLRMLQGRPDGRGLRGGAGIDLS